VALNEETLAALPDEFKARYRALEAVFGSDGWAWIKAWATVNSQDQLARLVHAANWDDNRFAKGCMTAYDRMLALEQEIEAEYTAYVEDLKSKEQLEVEADNE
jgi:hypothetical protein